MASCGAQLLPNGSERLANFVQLFGRMTDENEQNIARNLKLVKDTAGEREHNPTDHDCFKEWMLLKCRNQSIH